MSKETHQTTLTQTCKARPSQWEGTLSDGRAFYVRYRWGWLGIWVSQGPEDDPCLGEEVYSLKIGEPYDGVMSEEAMLEHLQRVNWDEA